MIDREYWGIAAASAALVLALAAQALGADCPSAPQGLPTIAGTELVCHTGYASLLDPALKESRLVTYRLTPDHAVGGCLPRAGLIFKLDPLAPKMDQGDAEDYAHSGFDLGHLANNADFAWDKSEQADTFSMANVAPQLPGLNRMGWESGESMVRAWAYAVGPVDVFVGPIFAAGQPTIGIDKIPVPVAFFKVIYVEMTGAMLSFEMPQKAIAKMTDLSPWVVSRAKVEADAGFTLPIPGKPLEATTMWKIDMAAWRKGHASACHH